MNITCAICKEIFAPSDDVYSTQCGHVFHLLCIQYWFQTKKTCPTCREKATTDPKSSHRIIRMFFDSSYSPDVPQDVGLLQQELDNLNFKMKMKEKESRLCKQSYDEAEKVNKGLRAEVRNLECKLGKINEDIYYYKERLRDLHQAEDRNAELKKENEALKHNMDHYQNIKELLQNSIERGEKIIESTVDLKKLKTYTLILKRTLEDTTNKYKESRDRNKLLRQNVADLEKQRNNYKAQCEKFISMKESWIISERRKLEAAQKASKPECSKTNSEEKTSDADPDMYYTPNSSPSKATKRKVEKCLEENLENCTPKKKSKSSPIKLDSDESDSEVHIKKTGTKRKENEENSPYLQAKGGVSSLRMTLTKQPNYNFHDSILFAKKRRLMLNSHKPAAPCDGFGGRSKDSGFPSPTLKLKTKKPIENVVRPKKLKLTDVTKYRKLDSFIDLTGKTP